MKVLSCGLGQQSTALALMSAAKWMGEDIHPSVPVYDIVLFCDLGCEPEWVYHQLDFVADVYRRCGLNFVVLHFDLYSDHIQRIKDSKYIKMPLWTSKDGKKGKLRRACTMDYKIVAMQQYVKYELLGYRWREPVREVDKGAHEMHIGFSTEERDRIFDSRHPMFVNKFPLAEMGFTRKDSYAYNLEEWHLDTKGSSCYICPFHRNYYFSYLQQNHPRDYRAVVEFDKALEQKPDTCPVTSDLYIASCLKRVEDLTPEECDDAETFFYNGRWIWNGF